MATILIIDDEDAIRSIIRRVLEREGHTVHDAPNGGIGIQRARSELPDVVITDLIMPEREGIETIQELRGEFPGLKILAISGAGSVEEGGPLMDAELLGADASLAKPFQPDQLLRSVASLLDA